ncbi:MAG: TolC family protein [Treponema sp.]|jgi:outer membrane protein TolC|nr:TolC family protein [Treponema sp.]
MNFKKRSTGGHKGLPPVLMVLLSLVFSAGLPAQSLPMRLTPDEAVSLAIKNNLSLESARVSSDTKKRASDYSWNQFVPSVTVGGSLILDNKKNSATVTAGFNPNTFMPVSVTQELPQWHIGASIQMSVSISAAMFENMRRLRLDYEGGLISYEKAKAQIERDVRKSYYNMLLLQENIDLLRENFAAAGRRVEMARDNYNAGLAPELTLLQAQVNMENMKPSIDRTENQLKLVMARFAMDLGLPYDTRFELIPVEAAPTFSTMQMTDLISKAASGKPDIQELKQTIQVAQSARKALIYGLTPTLTLSWNAIPAFTRDPWKDSWVNSDYWQDSGSFTIALGLRLHSLFPFSTDFQAIKDMDDQIRIASIGLAQAVRGTEIEIYNTVLSLEQTRTTAKAQERTVDLAERTYRLTEQAYRAGLQDLLEVQNAELSLRQARTQMLEQQFNYLTGLIDLEYSIGVPFGTLSSGSNY